MATIVFDFDGTIADSLPLVTDVYQTLLPGRRAITQEEIQRLRRMSVQKVTAELGVSFWKIPFLLRRGRRVMHERIHEVEIFKDINTVIEKLHANGHELYVVSSNSTENVQLFLKDKGLDGYFKEVKGIAGLFGKAKALKKMTRKYKFDLSKTYYVGDEARDITAAKHAGYRMVSVTWGFNDEDLLASMHPDMLVDKPKDLLKVFAEA